MFFLLEIFIRFGFHSFHSCLIRILQMFIYMVNAEKGDLVGRKSPKSTSNGFLVVTLINNYTQYPKVSGPKGTYINDVRF